MRLLSHNLLQCNAKNCTQNNFPLAIKVDKSQIIKCEYRKEALQKLIPKLDWPALSCTVHDLGEKNFPDQFTQDLIENEDFMKQLHTIIMETHIITGKLVCPNCQRNYPIVNGIPNMILNDDEI
ncbi:hypothetical protein IMG5_018160 [Ichthyophthirius multifiliis]|uniref:Trm112p-like protein n=1 Tax=Ichthyophthirius multifiliis TaxID=5932 RepID=G0QKI2_ICHMU|nr:hypothetical protein IMG5_018160 [Ichthyophthirius multifiliis]EGR34278.1 hypothetical protein IMG5_018160 [Ichthyophthirius multifiliis]|eukprot:XP_004039582.1 hypothetical protein IMG5_018160 [Ichthyophthirius multifiliis]